MVETNLIDHLVKHVRQQITEVSDHMARNGCGSWEDYKYCAGMVYALASMERELLDLNKKLEDD